MDQRKNIKVPEHLHKTIKRAAYLTGLSIINYLDATVSYDLHQLEKVKNEKPRRIR